MAISAVRTDSPTFSSAIVGRPVAKNYGELLMRTDCQITLPLAAIKMTARTDFTSRDDFSLPKR